MKLLRLFLLCILTVVKAQNQQNLNYFQTTAQKNSPLLNEYKNQQLLNKIDSLKLNATFGFIVSGEGSGFYAPVIKGWGYDAALTNNQTVFAAVRVTRDLISNENLKARRENFSAIARQITSQRNLSLQALDKQIAEQYIVTYHTQKLYELSEETLQLLRKEDVILKKLTEKTVFKQTDYLAFKVTLQQNELNLKQQLTDWQNNYALLYYLSGIVDDHFPPLSEPVLNQGLNKPFSQSNYAESFKADSLRLASDLQIIKYNYKPKLSVFADGGYQSSFVLTPYKNFGLSSGLALTIPIYDGHQKQMLINQNKLTLETRKAYADQMHRQYDQLRLSLENQIRQYEDMQKVAEEQMHYAETLVEANAKQLPTGDVRIVDYILSINNLLSLRTNLIQYNTALLSLKNQLQYLVLQ